jgi:hypothetical protein
MRTISYRYHVHYCFVLGVVGYDGGNIGVTKSFARGGARHGRAGGGGFGCLIRIQGRLACLWYNAILIAIPVDTRTPCEVLKGSKLVGRLDWAHDTTWLLLFRKRVFD